MITENSKTIVEKAKCAGVRRIGESIFILTFETEIASRAAPGQFVMVEPAGNSLTQPLLKRPFTFYDVSADAGLIEILIEVRGEGTRLLSLIEEGDEREIIGPLGIGFPEQPEVPRDFIMVGGGVGLAPFLHVSKDLKRRFGADARIHLFAGGRSKLQVSYLTDYGPYVDNLHVATDDGSRGHMGFVTDLLRERLPDFPRNTKLYACGPHGMFKSILKIIDTAHFETWFSMEERMACGFGACFGCVVHVNQGEKERMARSCLEGPVMRAETLEI
ncbi:MAG: dihydroorotate dehydrogenase electron transfer subunit [Planctomycetes bacterium]|nr:dihydroorotate dehydrogenase electron transfer subunit [Planctomycetota bacterium]